MTNTAIFIDPPSHHFLKDQLFDTHNDYLNRDGTLEPYARLRDNFAKRGIPVYTADRLLDGSKKTERNFYWTLGLLENYERLLNDSSIFLKGAILLEPPLVQPAFYKDLGRLSTFFENVFVHNAEGDGYSLEKVNILKLKKFYWPQPYDDVVEKFWHNRNRSNKLVLIAGAHNPKMRRPELYSERIKAVAALTSNDRIDLYGIGWDKILNLKNMWWTYWSNRSNVLDAYRGPCKDKLETLSNYKFSLCFENMPMKGFITEKIFDCFYAGTVPIYWGAPDIKELIPKRAFIDMRNYSNYNQLYEHISSLSDQQWENMRLAGKNFLQEIKFQRFYNSLENTISLN